MKIPKKLQPVLWSVNVNSLDKKKDKYYIIHQILIYGRMEDIYWLFNNYSKREIKRIFLQPYKNYPRFIFYFVKNYLLNCRDKQLNEDAYVTSISGPVKPRTPPGFYQA